MAPLVEATPTNLVKSTSTSATYSGSFDKEFNIGAVPNGGYSLACLNAPVLDFLTNHLKSSHKDLFHISATYLNATDPKIDWVVELQITKRGKGYTNIDANLIQKSHKTDEMTIRIQARLIYTDYSKNHADGSADYLTLQPGSRYYPTFPCLTDPKDITKNQFEGNGKIAARNRMAVYRDQKAQEAFNERGELSRAGYMHFLNEKVEIKDVAHFNYAAIMIFSDMTEKSLDYLPIEKRRENAFWYPTMFLSIEMKRALPKFPLLAASCMVRTRHVDHGQFEIDVEMWSHPDDAEKLNLPKGVKSVILCIARQVALTISLEAQANITVKKEKAKL